MIRFSANLGFLWPELALPKRIAAAAGAGFTAVELHWPYDTDPGLIRAACARYEVELLGINAPTGDVAKGEFGLAALPGREADFDASFDHALDYAVRAGAGSLHLLAGILPEGSRQQGARTIRENLARVAPKAAAHGLTILLEPINLRDKPGYFYSRCEEVQQIIRDLAVPNIRMMFDVYHIGVSQGDIIRNLERCLSDIGHVQIAAVPSRHEPDEGELAIGRILQHLLQLGYNGWVGAEYNPRGRTSEGLAWMRALSSGRSSDGT